MKKTERLNGVIFALKERGKLTAKELSNIFEVSERTIYRDIDALSQLKVPIVVHEGLYGGYEIDHTYFIPSIQLSEEEIIMLLMVLKAGEKLKIPNLTAEFQLLKSKIMNTLSNHEQGPMNELFDRFDVHMSRIEPTSYINRVLKPILTALKDSLNLMIAYYNPEMHVTKTRKVSPHHLFYSEGGWYLSGHCHLRNQLRTFRLDRIKEIELLDEANVHKNSKVKSKLNKFDEITYDLEIDASLFRIIKEDDYMTQRSIKYNNETINLTVTTKYESSITHLVLNHPNRVTLLGPIEYVNKIKQKIQTLAKKY